MKVAQWSHKFRTLMQPDLFRIHWKSNHIICILYNHRAIFVLIFTHTTLFAFKLLKPKKEIFLKTRFILTGLFSDCMISTLFTNNGSMLIILISRNPFLYSRVNSVILSAIQSVSPAWHRRKCCAKHQKQYIISK